MQQRIFGKEIFQDNKLTRCSRTEEVIASVHAASADDVDKAVKAAAAALKNPSWKELPASDRGILMARLADLVEENKELFATVDAWDNGEPKLAPT